MLSSASALLSCLPPAALSKFPAEKSEECGNTGHPGDWAKPAALASSECINLIASENVQSPAVQQIEGNDFMCRYAEGHPNTLEADQRYYEGTRFIDQVEALATKEMIELAGCQQADVRPISGNQANTAVALALLRGGDTVLCNSIDVGGHISHNPIGVFGRRIQVRGQVLALQKENSINMAFWPTTPDGYHLDGPTCMDLVEQKGTVSDSWQEYVPLSRTSQSSGRSLSSPRNSSTLRRSSCFGTDSRRTVPAAICRGRTSDHSKYTQDLSGTTTRSHPWQHDYTREIEMVEQCGSWSDARIFQ